MTVPSSVGQPACSSARSPLNACASKNSFVAIAQTVESDSHAQTHRSDVLQVRSPSGARTVAGRCEFALDPLERAFGVDDLRVHAGHASATDAGWRRRSAERYSERRMKSAIRLRLSALVLGLLAMPLGLVWAYWIALLALPLGGGGLLLLRAAERRAPHQAAKPAERRLHMVARGVIWLSFAASATALVAVLIAG